MLAPAATAPADELLSTAELVAIVRAVSAMAKRDVARQAAGQPSRASDAWEVVLRFVRATLVAECAPRSWEPDADDAALQAVRVLLAHQKEVS